MIFNTSALIMVWKRADRTAWHPISWNFIRKAPQIFQFAELYRPIPCIKRIWRSKKTDQRTTARCHFFQRRLCNRSGCNGWEKCKVPTIIHESDMTPGLQIKFRFLPPQKSAVTSGDIRTPAKRKSGLHRLSDPTGTPHGKC